MSYTPAGPDNQAIRETRDLLKNLNSSSLRLEEEEKVLRRWTQVLVTFTAVLIVLTAVLVWRTF